MNEEELIKEWVRKDMNKDLRLYVQSAIVDSFQKGKLEQKKEELRKIGDIVENGIWKNLEEYYKQLSKEIGGIE